MKAITYISMSPANAVLAGDKLRTKKEGCWRTPSKGRCDQISGGGDRFGHCFIRSTSCAIVTNFFLERARRVLRLHSVITNNIGFGR